VIKVVLKPDAGTKGRIRVTTRPPKAQVYLDGQRRCKATPCYIAKVALAVPLELRVEKKGYQTERRELKVEDAETALPVHISLNRAAGGKPDPGAAPALLSINSVPSGAKVMLDGEMTGELTPVEDLEIPAGRKVTVALAKKGFKLYSTTIIIKAGQRKDIPLAVLARLGSTGAPSEGPTDGGSALPPTGPGGKQGYLNVTVNVPCDVLVDGQRIGPAPVRRHLIAAGPHQVRLVNEDEWLDKKFRVLIKAGESVDRPLQLRKGRLTFAALPGTEIFIGKRKLGQTPMQAVSLFEGKYTFRVVDSQLGKSKTITEMVEAGKNKIVDIEIK